MSERAGWILTTGGSLLLWGASALSAGNRELWDVPSYWSVWLPLACALSFGLGFLVPARAWRWGFVVMLWQLPAVAIAAGSFGLFPLALLLVLVLGVPAGILSALGGWLRGRLAREA